MFYAVTVGMKTIN